MNAAEKCTEEIPDSGSVNIYRNLPNKAFANVIRIYGIYNGKALLFITEYLNSAIVYHPPPGVMALLAMGFLQTTQYKDKHKSNMSMIFIRQVAFYVFISYMQVTYAPHESQLFEYSINPRPQ